MARDGSDSPDATAASSSLSEQDLVQTILPSSYEPIDKIDNTYSGVSSSEPSSHVAAENEPHDDVPVEEPVVATPRGLGWWQLLAMIQKNALLKYRTPWSTLFEILSPALMMLVLILAYQLSEVDYKEERVYTRLEMEIPGPWLDLIRYGGGGLATVSDTLNMLDGGRRRLEHDIDEQEQIWKTWPDSAADVLQLIESPTVRNRLERRLQFGSEEGTTFDVDDEGEDLDVYDLLKEGRKQLNRLLQDPLPVPSFSQYVGLATTFSTLIDAKSLPRLFTDSDYGREWGNLLTLGTLHLSPNTTVTWDFWRYLNETYPLVMDQNNLLVRLHETEKDALDFINDNLNERTFALLDFGDWLDEEPSSVDQDVKFKIRQNYTTLPNTNEIVNFVTTGLSRDYQRYYLSGYLSLQRTLNEFAFSQAGDRCTDMMRNTTSNMWSMPMPTAAYSQNTFYLAVGYLLGLSIVMAYLYPTSRLIKSLVEEKETRMKETLFILGVRPWAHWWSWLVSSLITFFIIAILVTWMLSANVLIHSSSAYLFILIWLFSTATIGFCFVIATIFSKAKLASIIGPIALFVTLLPRYIFFGYNRYEATTAKKVASLLPATAFAFAADIIADYEYAEQGVQSWNASQGDYSYNTALAFLFFDTLLYMALAWYLDQVLPRKYGSPRPWYFLVSPRYWLSYFSCWRKSDVSDVTASEDQEVHSLPSGDESSHSLYEIITDPSLIPRVEICGLTKRYKKSQTLAVDDLNLTLYESQITALLGHNGAGKSTTVALLTGLFPPTKGDCIIYGKSIKNDPIEARHSIGICPQENILFDRLTVCETITFFRRIKGVRTNHAAVKAQAEEIVLEDFLHTTAESLSGGNKRKLSLAIAFCGSPRFLCLDEPTSGMDPSSRRACWDLLRRKRMGRVILLSTHFMDEAEVLSDRIAVLSKGKLQCSGSPHYLKSRFNLGYNFTAVLDIPPNKARLIPDEEVPAQVSSESDNPDVADSEALMDRARTGLAIFLKERVPGTVLVRKFGKEITFRFPIGSEKTFPAMFDELELAREQMYVGAFGIDNASLEEVFLLLAEEEETDLGNRVENEVRRSCTEEEEADSISDRGVQRSSHEYKQLPAWRQIGVLYRKRCTIQKRDYKGAFFSIVVPVLVVALVLLILTLQIPIVGPSIELSPRLYQTSSSGGPGETEVLVAGGASIENKSIAADWIAGEHAELRSLLQTEYQRIRFNHLREATSSAELSLHLLNTYNHHNHSVRYGAYALKDSITLAVVMKWDEMFEGLRALRQSSAFDSVDLVKTFGGNTSQLRLNVTTSDVADIIYSSTGLTPDTAANVADVQGLTGAALENILLANEGELTIDSVLEVRNNSTDDPLSLIDSLAELVTFEGPTVREETSALVLNVLDLFGAGDVAFVTEWMDPLLDNSSVVFDSALVAFIIAADTVLKQALENDPDAMVNVGAIFESLSEALGGGSAALDGHVLIEASSVILFVKSGNVEVKDLNIMSEAGTLLQLGTLNVTSQSIEALLHGNATYYFDIATPTSVLHNASSPHAVGAFNQAFHDFVYKRCTGSRFSRLVSVNDPLPLTTQQDVETKTLLSILAAFFILIPYCYIPGAFIVFLVRERTCKSKHLQLCSGVSLSSYWVANYLFDVTLFLILTILVMMVFLLYTVGDAAVVFAGDVESFFCTFMLTFGYGISVLPFSYLISRRFSNHSSAQIAVIGIVFITGFVAVNAYFIMDSIERTEDIAQGLRPWFRTFPAYNVGEGLIQLAAAYWEREILFLDKRPFDWDVAGKNVALLYILFVPYFLLLMFLEYSQDGGAGGVIGRFLRRVRAHCERIQLRCYGVRKHDGELLLDDGLPDDQGHEDEDVRIERVYVSNHVEELRKTASVLYVNLWKIFPPSVGLVGVFMSSIRRGCASIFCCPFRSCRPQRSTADIEEESQACLPKRAVRGVSLVVQRGETFALLGANGAGKSTTMSILTGDTTATSGRVYVAQHDVTGEEPDGVSEARRHIGFCPQVNPLLDLITCRETLRMFAKIRGIPSDQVESQVDRLLDRLTLTPHADKTTETLSGGNKRKLSLGIALIGDPAVLLIDESSSGMDPLARRNMWDLISDVSQDRSVMLTTHSMQEAEALCTRAGIMVAGQLLCLGSVQHLKTKFLDGYTIDIYCSSGSTQSDVDRLVKELVENALPGSHVAERHGRFVRLDISSLSSLGLGATFRNLEEIKADPRWNLENYSISQCSFEQVFIELVHRSTETTDDDTEAT